jgi:uncharacterized protein YsxB (DUF464 family)
MINICFSELAFNKIELIIKGHSSNNKGKDIVCAAVSALTQTFIRGIEKNLEAKLQGNFLTGNCDLLIEVPNKFSQEFRIVCNIFKEGFHKISESYPEQVNLI